MTQPQNDSILTDRTYTISCIVTGSPFPQVVWLKDGTPINYTDNVYLQLFDASLHFANVELEDAGSYQCNVTNERGYDISDEVALIVQGKDLYGNV